VGVLGCFLVGVAIEFAQMVTRPAAPRFTMDRQRIGKHGGDRGVVSAIAELAIPGDQGWLSVLAVGCANRHLRIRTS